MRKGLLREHRFGAGAHHGNQQRESRRDNAGSALPDHVRGQARAEAWKTHSWDVLDRLHDSGYIYEPATKAKSVMLTEEGSERSKRLFEKHFMTD
jgi:hypothetical protein